MTDVLACPQFETDDQTRHFANWTIQLQTGTSQLRSAEKSALISGRENESFARETEQFTEFADDWTDIPF